jgi:preprotein translocase subunit SecF
LGAGTLKDIALALFIGMIVGAYSSVFIAPAILAQLREKEPAMMALAKRVNARGGATATADSAVAASSPTVAVSVGKRGPRNQPKRKNRK